MGWITKKITVPESNATKEVDAIQLWEVRWQSNHSPFVFASEMHPEVEGFPTEQEANEFATALRNAFTLIRGTHCTKVTVKRAR